VRCTSARQGRTCFVDMAPQAGHRRSGPTPIVYLADWRWKLRIESCAGRRLCLKYFRYRIRFRSSKELAVRDGW